MIYLFQELTSLSDEHFHQMIYLLPKERQEYVKRYKKTEDQKQSTLAWLLLNYGLKQEYGIKKIPFFQKMPSGKPFFPEKNMPFFNLSHSGSFAGCALHNEEVGLDIQKLTLPRASLVKKVCTESELASAKSELDFCRIWAMKESAVKLTGEGITGSFRDFLMLHPEIHIQVIPLKENAGFLAYSTYTKQKLPIVTVSATQLLERV